MQRRQRRRRSQIRWFWEGSRRRRRRQHRRRSRRSRLGRLGLRRQVRRVRRYLRQSRHYSLKERVCCLLVLNLVSSTLNIYESPNFTLKCKTKIVSYAPWLYNDSRMSRERPTGRYYTHKRTIEEKPQHIKLVNVHALNFNTLLDDVRTIQVQTKLRETLYDLKYAPLWDEEGGDHDFLLYLNPGHLDREVVCDMMRNRLERATSTLRDFVDDKTSRGEGDEFSDQDPWVPLVKRPPK
jgi:hypothetical protein